MAAADRPPAEHLTFLQRAQAQVRRYGLFSLVRGAEARAPQLPRVGRRRNGSLELDRGLWQSGTRVLWWWGSPHRAVDARSGSFGKAFHLAADGPTSLFEGPRPSSTAS